MHGDGNDNKAKQSRLEERNKVRSLLYEAGLTLLAIDKKYSLARGTCSTTLREPNAAGEKAIAKALRIKPSILWPSRYYANGRRKTPQPRQNYERTAIRGRDTLSPRQQQGAA